MTEVCALPSALTIKVKGDILEIIYKLYKKNTLLEFLSINNTNKQTHKHIETKTQPPSASLVEAYIVKCVRYSCKLKIEGQK